MGIGRRKMIKKILITIMLLSLTVYAQQQRPKMGCILAQQGKVNVTLDDKVIEDVKYIPIKAEGINFKQILVGSKFIINNELNMKILDIKANKRVNKKDPRTGTITMQVLSNSYAKNIPMEYTFANNIMKANGNVNSFGLNSIGFEMNINAILCAVK